MRMDYEERRAMFCAFAQRSDESAVGTVISLLEYALPGQLSVNCQLGKRCHVRHGKGVCCTAARKKHKVTNRVEVLIQRAAV